VKGALRVIAGSARGQRLKSVPGDITRPITDRVKEALFSILGPDIQDANVLDLFAGTGSVGIEALSRGAEFVRFNDRHRLAITIIKENLASTKLTNGAEITQMDAFSLLKGEADLQFDYVYIAPPQYKGLWVQALQLIDEKSDWLAEDAWIILQIDPTELEEVILENLVKFDQRKYGSTLLIFYILKE
jgi:16S rRNA (guanine(966)-N(2))-methyltransferase RsmD